MHEVNGRSSVRRSRIGLGIATAALATVLAVFTTTSVFAAGAVSKLVFNPNPIGTEATVAAGTSVSITLTVEDSTGAAVPGGSAFVSFVQTPGGGTAFIGSTGLTAKQTVFTADTSGHIAIVYTTPPSFPSAGCDSLRAENGPTRATSTVFKTDGFCFSPITALDFAPKPMARKGSLGASSHVTVTLTGFGSGATRLANGTVWLTFKRATTTDGATALANGVVLSTTASALTTNSNGQVFITYSTGTVLPTSGSDRLIAANGPKLATITATTAYTY
jgi:hypothetical protein